MTKGFFKMNKKNIILFLVLIVFMTVPVSANNFNFESNFGIRSGYSTYIINDNNENWQSKLEFPLDYNFVEFSLDIDLWDNFRTSELSYLTNISDKSKNSFIDSDWSNTMGEGDPDIYAEAESIVDMSEFDFKVLFDHNLIANNSDNFLGLGFGYKRSDHNFMVVGPGFQKDNINKLELEFGKNKELLEYNLEIKAPYILLYSETPTLEGNIKFYPRVDIYDLDHHILRNKYSEGETKGKGIEFNLKYKKELKKGLKFNAEFTYETFNTEGEQHQWFTDMEEQYLVNHEIEYTTRSIMAGLTYKF